MKSVRTIVSCLLIISCCTSSLADDYWSTHVVRIADDLAEWPPYTYFVRKKNGEVSKQIAGLSIDVIEWIFTQNNMAYTVELLPWQRAQAEVAKGNRYHMLLNASYSDKRNKTYLLTKPYYQLNLFFFYSKKYHKKPPRVTGVGDLKKRFKTCGIFGYSYAARGFAANEVDAWAKNYDLLINALHKHGRRCDVFIEGYEIMIGFSYIGNPLMKDPLLGYAKLPGLKQEPFYMMVSRRIKQGDKLVDIMNKGVIQLVKTGKMKALFEKYQLLYPGNDFYLR
ncbi:transporter substrate-binding domain-containing protein [Endozoicomonas sp. SM1973]|uniref:Transporter substrate-binding domain-containing protein n=1 Tax=Spartinivicinus marinus TaxID=2994442 RepID=A0A853I6Z5_9GAMM|nr:transporter substrate-binding domain-containing protein [Spartinivicinus marinus]MCX4028670.1 transporter substrate-binding domain-containing protein [Spartinivicinus marinus]NYZ69083.1 transporter substrate-binding domain-containing protein [Spartinivicinus marinus]